MIEQYSLSIKHNIVPIYRFCNYRYIVIVDSGSVLVSGKAACLSCRHELCRAFINFPNMQTAPPTRWIFFLDVDAISWDTREGVGGESDG